MNQIEVIEKLQRVFDGVLLEPVTLTRALTSADVAEWDSLTHITLVAAVERAFGVRFRTGEVERTNNVGEP